MTVSVSDYALATTDPSGLPLASDDREPAEPLKPAKSRKRLTAPEIGRILALRDAGMTMADIARKLDRHHTTVQKCLDSLTDTRPAAKAMLQAAAAQLAGRIADKARPEVCVDVLERLEVLRPKQTGQGNQGVQVLIGVAGLPGLPTLQTGAKVLPDAPGMVHVSAKSLETKDQVG